MLQNVKANLRFVCKNVGFTRIIRLFLCNWGCSQWFPAKNAVYLDNSSLERIKPC